MRGPVCLKHSVSQLLKHRIICNNLRRVRDILLYCLYPPEEYFTDIMYEDKDWILLATEMFLADS